MKLAPVLIFTYNRPWHTLQTLTSVRNNTLASSSDIIIYSDGPKISASPDDSRNIEKVREIIHRQDWDLNIKVRTSSTNKGLAKSIIEGVTETLREYEHVIVLEDDMVVSPHFLTYMNEALTKYENEGSVISVHGFNLPINYKVPFFLKGADCWGWATWRRGWSLFRSDGRLLMNEIMERKSSYEFDLEGAYQYTEMLQNQIDGKNNSWAIRWYASAFLENKLTLYPGISLVRNIGNDNSGTHRQDGQFMKTEVSDEKIVLQDIPIKESTLARELISKYLLKHSNLNYLFC